MAETQLRRLHILLIEDSALDADILTKFLQYNDIHAEFFRVDTAAELHQILGTQSWDLVFCDYHIHPSFTCYDALTILREYNNEQEAQHSFRVPIIIVSSVINESKIVDLMNAGASDFVIKGYFERLIPIMQRELYNVEKFRHYETIIQHLQQLKGTL